MFDSNYLVKRAKRSKCIQCFIMKIENILYSLGNHLLNFRTVCLSHILYVLLYIPAWTVAMDVFIETAASEAFSSEVALT